MGHEPICGRVYTGSGEKPKDSADPIRGRRPRGGGVMTLDALSERWEAFLGACLTIGDPERVANAASVLDDSFMLPELIDRWVEWVEDQPQPGSTNSAVPPDSDIRRHIQEHGFSFAASSATDAQSAASRLKRIVDDPDELYQLFDDIRFADELSEDWASRLIDVGRLPELRVYDLTKHVPLDPLGDNPELWPSPLFAKLKGSRLKGTVHGLTHFTGAYIGLFPLGSDSVFTRKPEFDPKVADKRAGKRGDYFRDEISLQGWRELVAQHRPQNGFIGEAEVDSDGAIRFLFDPIESARWLRDRILVVGIVGTYPGDSPHHHPSRRKKM